jgi:peptide/nickel transport system permease protein
MFRYAARRLLSVIPVILGITIVVFAVMHVIPGDPVQIMFGDETTGTRADPAEIARIRALLGLDQPVQLQYVKWMQQLGSGNLGTSLLERVPVKELLASRLPATVELTLAALLVSVLVGIPLGVLSAVHRNSWFDRLSLAIASLGVSIPGFWLGLMLILVFSLYWGLFPTSGRGTQSALEGLWLSLRTFSVMPFWNSIKFLILPALTLSGGLIALLSRLTRYSMLEVLNLDYIRTARAKGLSQRSVIYRHALRNALLPVVTVLGMQVGYLMSGTVLVETIFSWPGIGRLGYVSIKRLDYPVVQGIVLLVATIFALTNVITDLVYAVVDPRIRYD